VFFKTAAEVSSHEDSIPKIYILIWIVIRGTKI
jgi:hypothetical protein